MFDRFDWWGYAILAAVPAATFILGVLWARREMRSGRDPAGADSFTFVGFHNTPAEERATVVESEVAAISNRLANLEREWRDHGVTQPARVPTPV
jgi:hypothetical protein